MTIVAVQQNNTLSRPDRPLSKAYSKGWGRKTVGYGILRQSRFDYDGSIQDPFKVTIRL